MCRLRVGYRVSNHCRNGVRCRTILMIPFKPWRRYKVSIQDKYTINPFSAKDLYRWCSILPRTSSNTKTGKVEVFLLIIISSSSSISIVVRIKEISQRPTGKETIFQQPKACTKHSTRQFLIRTACNNMRLYPLTPPRNIHVYEYIY